MITIEFNGATAQLHGTLTHETKRRLVYELSYIDKQKVYLQSKYPGVDARVCVFDTRKQKFMTGFVPKVAAVLNEMKVPFTVVNTVEAAEGLDLVLPDWLYEHQTEAIAKALRYRRGIIQSPTGSGKTTIVAQLVRHFPNAPVLITVPTSPLMYKMAEVVAEATGEEIGLIGDSEKVIRRISVGIVNSVVNMVKAEDPYLQTIKVCIRDEAHGSACDMHQQVAEALVNVDYSLGVTATAFRSDGKDLLLEGVCGPIIYSATEEDMVAKGIIIRPEVHMVSVPDEKWVFPGAIANKSKSGKILGYRYNTDNGKPELTDVYKIAVVQNLNRHRLTLELVQAHLANPNRFGPCLILVENMDHGELLCQIAKEEFNLDVVFINGKNCRGKKRVEILDRVRAGELPVICASRILNEGEDIPTLEMVILASATGNAKIITQQIGRVVRTCPGKRRAVVVDLSDNEHYYLFNRGRNRQKIIEDRYGKNCMSYTTADKLKEYLSGRSNSVGPHTRTPNSQAVCAAR